ncbi:MAG: FAD-binding protein [Gammaproteobacteria bacterium]|nr:FAD-binding protein [Gammaproteobacteria bacterium]
MHQERDFSPLIIDGSSSVSWDEEADVVVVGFGGAGAATANEALDLGADVLAIDRFAGGGATAYSGGVLYAGGTRMQRQAGFEDSAENMFSYLSLEKSAVRTETLRRFCEGSNDDFEWLEHNGVPYSSDAYLEKTAYPPEGKFLYFSGNENVPRYKVHAQPVPRGHRAVGTGMSGYSHFSALREAAIAKRLRLRTHAPVRRLVLDRNGQVLGVEIAAIPEHAWKRHQSFYEAIVPMKAFKGGRYERLLSACDRFEHRFTNNCLIRARRGVILATGGFIFNSAMVKKYKPVLAGASRALLRLGSAGCDGSGIELARAAGAATDLMDSFWIGRTIAPPEILLRGVLVDSAGRRFINEDAYSGFIGDAISNLPDDGTAWLILDRQAHKKLLRQCCFPGKGMRILTLPHLLNLILGGTKKAGSLAQLARKCAMDPAALEETVRINNEAALKHCDDPQGKSPSLLSGIESQPFYAMNMSLSNRFAITMAFSLGGLRVDEATGVALRQDGTVIRGLYAAGRTAVGLCSKSYLSGMSIADTVFSGRRAARDAVSGSGGKAQSPPARL